MENTTNKSQFNCKTKYKESQTYYVYFLTVLTAQCFQFFLSQLLTALIHFTLLTHLIYPIHFTHLKQKEEKYGMKIPI